MQVALLKEAYDQKSNERGDHDDFMGFLIVPQATFFSDQLLRRRDRSLRLRFAAK